MSEMVRLSAALALVDGQSMKRNPSYRTLGVPVHMAESIKKWYEASGWTVTIEPLVD